MRIGISTQSIQLLQVLPGNSNRFTIERLIYPGSGISWRVIVVMPAHTQKQKRDPLFGKGGVVAHLSAIGQTRVAADPTFFIGSNHGHVAGQFDIFDYAIKRRMAEITTHQYLFTTTRLREHIKVEIYKNRLGRHYVGRQGS